MRTITLTVIMFALVSQGGVALPSNQAEGGRDHLIWHECRDRF